MKTLNVILPRFSRRLFIAFCTGISTPALAQNSLITSFSPVFNITPIGGPGGESVSLNTQISYGNFNGLGWEYLYQYQVTVNAGSPAVDGFNLWTAGATP